MGHSLITRPLLASPVKNFDKLNYPVWASPKLDGIRAMMVGGKLVSRNFKPIPNNYIREKLEQLLPDGIDGEILIRTVTKELTPDRKRDPQSLTFMEETLAVSRYNQISLDEDRPQVIPFNYVTSEVMSTDGEPDFQFCAFDYVSSSIDTPYLQRIEELVQWYLPQQSNIRLRLIAPVEICNREELDAYEMDCLERGFEGIMLRRGDGQYKCGRSTEKEGILLKVKQFVSDEAYVIGFEEKMHNINEKVADAFGLSKRSSEKAGMVGTNTLGSFLVRDLKSGMEFSIGSGMNDSLRFEIWQNKDVYMGKIVRYKHQPHGSKDLPRFPVFEGFRSVDDMSE